MQVLSVRPRRPVMRRFLFSAAAQSLLALMCAGLGQLFCSRCEGSDAQLESIRQHAHSCVSLLPRVMYEYRYESEGGTIANVKFLASDGLFRVDRDDIRGQPIQGQMSPPMSLTVAYDGKRQQTLDRKLMSLRVKGGSDGATYGINTPCDIVYAWISPPHCTGLRWDAIVSDVQWETRFGDATYVGKVDDHGRVCEVVDFPQEKDVKTPCYYRVFFAPDLGYLPVKYERRIKGTNTLSSSMQVDRYETFDVDGTRVAVPTKVSYQETGADQASLKCKIIMTVDSKTLKINDEVQVADGIFTLDTSNVTEIFDVDKYEKAVMDAGRKEEQE